MIVVTGRSNRTGANKAVAENVLIVYVPANMKAAALAQSTG